MPTQKTNRRFYCVFFGILFVFLCLLSFVFPYSGDDWAWGTREGEELLAKGFVDYNGRYAGNLMEMAATRSRPLRALMEGALLTAIPALITALSDRKKKNRCRRQHTADATVLAGDFSTGHRLVGRIFQLYPAAGGSNAVCVER